MTDDKPPFPFPEIPGVAEWEAQQKADAEEERGREFTARRQRELAAKREARRRALERGEIVFDPPRPADGPEVVAVVESQFPGMAGAPAWVHEKRREAWAILLDGVLAMSDSGLRLEGRPADAALAQQSAVEPPAPRSAPRKSVAKAKPTKTRQRASGAPQRAEKAKRTPKARPVLKQRPERPAPPDEVRCTASNSRGSRCKLERVAGGQTCLLHS